MKEAKDLRCALAHALTTEKWVNGRTEAPAFPRPEWDVQAEGWVVGEQEAFAAHLARAELARRLQDARRSEEQVLQTPVSYERTSQPAGEWIREAFGAPSRLGPRGVGLVQCLERQLAPAVRRLDGVGLAMDARGQAAMAYRSWGVGPHADIAPDLDPAAVLAETNGLMEEVAARLSVADGLHWPLQLADKRIDALLGVERRHRRVAAPFEGTPLFEGLRQRVKVRPRLATTLHPRIRFRRQYVELTLGAGEGLAAEYDAAMAVGRAMGLAAIDPQVPPALRFPVVGSVARALGGLMAQLLLDAGGMSRAEGAARRLRLAGRWLVELRLAAAALIAATPPAPKEAVSVPGIFGEVGVRPRAADGAEERFARSLQVVRRALCAPTSELAVAGLRVPSARARLRGLLGGLRWFVSLRERFDEDWVRNPRSAAPLFEHVRQGGLRSVESILDDLDAPTGVADRIQEWL